MQMSMFLSAEPPARTSPSRGFERALMESGEISHGPSLKSLDAIAPGGWFGRTSPALCHSTEAGILAPSSGRWGNSGMGGPIESWTLNTTEWPSDGAVCFLSDVLETGDVPQQYFLSAKACRGILRRAEKRGKTLPRPLAHALQAVADSEPIST